MPLLILITSLLVLSQSAIFIRFAEAHAAAIGFWRLVIAIPVLLLILSVQKRWGEIFELRLSQWLWLALCGFFLFAHFHTWFLSVQKTTVANAMILFGLNPLFTAFGAFLFFKERVEWRHAVAMLLCLVGLYFLLEESLRLSQEHYEGYLLGIACSALFSAYILVSKGLRRGLHSIPFSTLTYSFCLLCFTILMVLLKVPFWGYSLQSFLAFSGLAFGSTLMGHALFTHSLQFFNVNLMSISTLAEPIFTAFSGYLFFREPLSRGAILGFIFVSAGILAMYFPYLRDLWKGRAKIWAKNS